MSKTVLEFSWGSVRAAGADRGVIDIRGGIGLPKELEEWGIESSGTVSEFAEAVKALGAVREIELNVSSFGGEVFAALGMYAILARHSARVVAYVDGVAASAATVLLMAADEIRMPANSYLMIHNATWIAAGDHRAMAKAAEDLKKWSRDMANLYAARMEDNLGGDRAEILGRVIAMMDEETWLTGEEAVAAGLAETVTDRVELAACAAPEAGLRPKNLDRVPAELRALLIDRPTGSMSEPAAIEPTEPALEASAPTEPELEAGAPTEPATEPATEPTEPTEPVPAAAPSADLSLVVPPTAPPQAAGVSLDEMRAALREEIAAAVNPLAERLANAEAALQREEQLRAAGVPQAAWGAQRPAEIGPRAEGGEEPVDFASLTPSQKVRMAREKMFPKASV
jgi:ATP-dependent protease ClpP protease subunit